MGTGAGGSEGLDIGMGIEVGWRAVVGGVAARALSRSLELEGGVAS